MSAATSVSSNLSALKAPSAASTDLLSLAKGSLGGVSVSVIFPQDTPHLDFVPRAKAFGKEIIQKIQQAFRAVLVWFSHLLGIAQASSGSVPATVPAPPPVVSNATKILQTLATPMPGIGDLPVDYVQAMRVQAQINATNPTNPSTSLTAQAVYGSLMPREERMTDLDRRSLVIGACRYASAANLLALTVTVRGLNDKKPVLALQRSREIVLLSLPGLIFDGSSVGTAFTVAAVSYGIFCLSNKNGTLLGLVQSVCASATTVSPQQALELYSKMNHSPSVALLGTFSKLQALAQSATNGVSYKGPSLRRSEFNALARAGASQDPVLQYGLDLANARAEAQATKVLGAFSLGMATLTLLSELPFMKNLSGRLVVASVVAVGRYVVPNQFEVLEQKVSSLSSRVLASRGAQDNVRFVTNLYGAGRSLTWAMQRTVPVARFFGLELSGAAAMTNTVVMKAGIVFFPPLTTFLSRVGTIRDEQRNANRKASNNPALLLEASKQARWAYADATANCVVSSVARVIIYEGARQTVENLTGVPLLGQVAAVGAVMITGPVVSKTWAVAKTVATSTVGVTSQAWHGTTRVAQTCWNKVKFWGKTPSNAAQASSSSAAQPSPSNAGVTSSQALEVRTDASQVSVRERPEATTPTTDLPREIQAKSESRRKRAERLPKIGNAYNQNGLIVAAAQASMRRSTRGFALFDFFPDFSVIKTS